MFIDLRRAFYSILLELALGPLQTSEARKRELQSLQFTDDQLVAFRASYPT